MPRFILFVCFFSWISLLGSQTPFDCDGRIYRVVEEQGGSSFQEIRFTEDEQDILIENRAFFGGRRINAIGYRPSDNLIYGLLLGDPYILCRIDADYQLSELQALPSLPSDLLFVSADISPDERYLVLLGFTPSSSDNLLALVDLDDPNYGITILPIAKTNPSARLYCADIAFHPTQALLYGYEHSEGRLITIDLANGLVDNTSYPIQAAIRGNVPSLFFSASGELYGVGAAENVFSNRSLYRFNTLSGAGEIISTLGFERNQDACSCPFKVELLKEVSHRNAFPCTLLEITFTLINRTDRLQSGLFFRDTFPVGTLIQQIEPLDFPASIRMGVGSNVIQLDSIELEVGQHSFRLQLAVLEEAEPQDVWNTAYLGGVRLSPIAEASIIRSDDPGTPAIDDPTYFNVRPLSIDFAGVAPVLCEGDSLLLLSGIPNANFYRWSDGSSGERLLVHQPGRYAVTVSTPCAETSNEIIIIGDTVKVSLGADRQIESGSQINWTPQTQSSSPIIFYQWNEQPDTTLSCYVCPEPSSQPLRSSQYDLVVRNTNGCSGEAMVRVAVNDLQIYAPTAFSPNFDGLNDYFYLQSHEERMIRQWQVFDRWGGMVFQAEQISTNYPEAGWDGSTPNGQPANSGAYVWHAWVLGANGEARSLKGLIYLLR